MISYVCLLIKSLVLIYLNKLNEFVKINFESKIDVDKIYKKINYYGIVVLFLITFIFILIGMLLDIFMSQDIREIIRNNEVVCEIIIMIVSFFIVPKIKIEENLSFINNQISIIITQMFYNLSLFFYMCCNCFLVLSITKVLNLEIMLGTLSLTLGILLIKSIFDYVLVNKNAMNMYLFSIVMVIINMTFIGMVYILNKYKISEIIENLNKFKLQGNIIFILVCIGVIYILNLLLYSKLKKGIKINVKKDSIKLNYKRSFKNNLERFIYKYICGFKFGYSEVRISIMIGSFMISTIIIFNFFKKYTYLLFEGEFAIIGGYLLSQGIALIIFIVLTSLDYKVEKQLVRMSNYKEENYYKLIKDYTIIVLIYISPMIIMVQAINWKNFNILNLITLIILFKEAISLKVIEVLYYAEWTRSDKIGRKICEALLGVIITLIIVCEVYLFINITNEYILFLIQINISVVLFSLKKFIRLKCSLVYL